MKKQQGFTVIELAIVIAFFGALCAGGFILYWLFTFVKGLAG